ncbi:hypothetical protein [Polaromonas sp.]|uniref:hypothetical protein n=1 Tax=Polaromonas sp. TaxID=1869339 RepID=UPI0013B8D73D|nr:hypothetical protein [Polaromonas sp.]NDP61073.1 hypothetical protein [Polaromonas sp.]
MIEKFEIPHGYVLRKAGGRPPKDARNIAIFLAKHFQTKHLGNSARKADEWILKQWSTRGLTDDAHVRRACREASPLLNKHFIIASSDGLAFVKAVEGPIKNGSKGWIWADGLLEAFPVEVKNFEATTHSENYNFSPLALAARSLFAI